ncbi:hypothetical protein E2C01_034949 [Portunus trituberculatus]|uniref:Uncharacterized protein n=1 Tax=Portunus trituberculatus TaxID=210409 RepID=A0A5B7F1W4_PORTR|nr:hypothetical protein [Portunus trituberculatus]
MTPRGSKRRSTLRTREKTHIDIHEHLLKRQPRGVTCVAAVVVVMKETSCVLSLIIHTPARLHRPTLA